MAQGVIFKRSISGACRAARAEANSVGFMARLLMQSTIALAASGCAQSLPTASAFGTPHTLAGPLTQHFYSEWMYSSQPSQNEVVVYKRKRSGFGLTPYETLTSGFSAPMGMVTTPDGRWYIANSGEFKYPGLSLDA